MIVQLRKVIEDVRTAIDMNRRDSALSLEQDIDTLELDGMIVSKVADAVRLVEIEAPFHLLETGMTFSSSSVVWTGGGRGWLLLPDDFLRLVVFRMSDWERGVYTAITADMPLYARQSSRYKGIYGTPRKPVVAIIPRAEGVALEFFSCDSEDAVVSQAVYRSVPVIADGGIELSMRCYDAIVYRIAGMVLGSTGDELSSTMLELSKSLLI